MGYKGTFDSIRRSTVSFLFDSPLHKRQYINEIFLFKKGI